jgi:predicted flap endonuclease-1-like 5' DNA nuclease
MYLSIFTQLFTDFTTRDSWNILAYLFGAFLLGLLTYWTYFADKMGKIKEVLKKREAELATAQDEANGLRAQVTKRDEDVKRGNQVIDEMTTIQRRIESEKKTYQADALNAKGTIDKIQKDNGALNVQIQSLGEQIVGLRMQSTDLTAKVYEKDKALASFTDLNTNFNATLVRAKTLEEQVKMLEGEKTQLKEELSRFKVGDVRVASGSPLTNTTVVTTKTSITPQATSATSVTTAEKTAETKPEIVETETPPTTPTPEEIAALDTPNDVEVTENVENSMATETATVIPTVTPAMSTNARTIFTGTTNAPEDPISRGKAAIKSALGTALTQPAMGAKDDLKQIVGIGPFLEERLNALGICTYQQLTELDDALIAALTDAIQFLPGRIKKDDWSGQAKLLMEG